MKNYYSILTQLRYSKYVRLFLPPAFLLILFYRLSSHLVSGGADIVRHLKWAEVFDRVDLYVLGEGSGAFGTVVHQWNHGAGLILSLGYWLQLDRIFNVIPIFGLLFNLATFSILLKILPRFFDSRSGRVLFVSVLLLGTHFGHLLYTISSDSISSFFLLLSFYLAIEARKNSTMDIIFVSISCFFLIITRNQLVLFLVPIFVILFFKQTTFKHAILGLLLFGLIACLAFIQVFTVNYWMTGSILKSPYSFGGGGFKSIDLSNTELLSLLISPWHGLLVYHPGYLILSFLVLLGIGNQNTPVKNRLVSGLTLVFFCMHLYVLSAWYCWWLGKGTFGQRGAAYLPFLTLGLLFLNGKKLDKRINVIVVPAFIFTLWSWILMFCGPNSYSNFYSFKELAFGAFDSLKFAAGFIIYFSISNIQLIKKTLCGSVAFSKLTSRFLLLAFLYLCLFRFFVSFGFRGEASILASLFVCYIMYSKIALWIRWMTCFRSFWFVDYIGFFTKKFLLILFTFSLFIFGAVAGRVFSNGLTPTLNRQHYFTSSDVIATYFEYLLIDGYDSKKSSLKNFLLEYCSVNQAEELCGKMLDGGGGDQ